MIIIITVYSSLTGETVVTFADNRVVDEFVATVGVLHIAVRSTGTHARSTGVLRRRRRRIADESASTSTVSHIISK